MVKLREKYNEKGSKLGLQPTKKLTLEDKKYVVKQDVPGLVKIEASYGMH